MKDARPREGVLAPSAQEPSLNAEVKLLAQHRQTGQTAEVIARYGEWLWVKFPDMEPLTVPAANFDIRSAAPRH